ncbi:TetR/AcrR family transcriptional regulator [Sphingomonas solaris]|uniref:TetR/AcrR family transcriptional regulator n=1 Tax=Alterirhizorhabdus solaris TaxID=2529389 RepID=A0A558QTW6_9SPHN|nr:TetR/AcrR family transcriptional regulator [Sphingomonas solaris]TVV70566.1 TetR/AcrR family transcriptional regulator [Sphingomonas solaris]
MSDGAADGDRSPLAARPDKTPKTARGRRTLRALLDAAAGEFGDRGFHEAAISRITARAGVSIGSFYTYFDSKEEVFTALVRDLSDRVGEVVGPAVAGERDGLSAERAGQRRYLEFVRHHKEIYRIIDEAEFVDPASYRAHYTGTAARIAARLEASAARGEISAGSAEVRAWALMGMNVFLGLRYGVWGGAEDLDAVTGVAGDLISHGLAPRSPSER